MAMTAASMKARIRTAQAAIAAPANNAGAAAAYSDAMLQALCQGIIDEIKAAAVVTVTNVSGVTVGGGVSGPGTGTVSA
jgi:hypothetical protein